MQKQKIKLLGLAETFWKMDSDFTPTTGDAEYVFQLAGCRMRKGVGLVIERQLNGKILKLQIMLIGKY